MTISNFKLDCCLLFDLVPLYTQRKKISDRGKYRLNVLIMGLGERMQTILNVVLTQGQLLDTELYVTAAVPNPGLFTDNLIESAPALTGFARITCDDSVYWSGKDDYMLADINVIKTSFKPESAIDVLGSVEKPGYVLVSGGNDEKNLAVASALFNESSADNTVTACVRMT